MDNKRQTALISLDISAAFDTINHRVLLERLSSDFSVDGAALDWLRSYLVDRLQFMKLGSHSSATVRFKQASKHTPCKNDEKKKLKIMKRYEMRMNNEVKWD